ncbi:hypothetical protein F511_45880 [Dorcoceras hygrometricum]|uniref:Uncharacterized protein n=1 Tax=Dorcoceras hygrometricum TaxID=472368 RepID=A0A2Z6ZUZ0_9LAMI|nr:hypothetical protein F511_45880 [Dorcoceras hygrometricum]
MHEAAPSVRQRHATVVPCTADLCSSSARNSSSGAGLPCVTIAHVARVHARDMEERRRARRLPGGRFSIFVSDLKFNVRYNYGNSYDQIRETLALIPLLGIRIRPPARQRKNKKQMPGGDQYEKSDNYSNRHT